MRHSLYLTLLLVAFVSGCTPEYVPPKEAIPDIPPSVRGGGETGAPGAGAAMPAGKAPGEGPSKMAKPK